MAVKRRPVTKGANVPVATASFIKSMECLPVTSLPDGPDWTYEIKLDGFRLEAVKNAGATTLYSRRGNVLNKKFRYIADALKKLPDAPILDGEVAALNAQIDPTSAYCRISVPLGPAFTTMHSTFSCSMENC